MKAGQCEFLIRDSQGKTCPKDLTCENDSFWVRSDRIVSPGSTLYWLPN